MWPKPSDAKGKSVFFRNAREESKASHIRVDSSLGRLMTPGGQGFDTIGSQSGCQSRFQRTP